MSAVKAGRNELSRLAGGQFFMAVRMANKTAIMATAWRTEGALRPPLHGEQMGRDAFPAEFIKFPLNFYCPNKKGTSDFHVPTCPFLFAYKCVVFTSL